MNNLSSHNKIRLKIMLSGLPASIISVFQKKDKRLVIFNSFFNLKFNSNTKYFFLYLLKNDCKSQYTIKYVINDDALRKSLVDEYGKNFIETNSFRGKLYALKARTWFLNSYELPVGGVFLKHQRNIICLSHGSPVKNEGTLEKNVGLVKRLYYKILHTNISHVLATSDAFAKVYSSYLKLPLNKVLVSGLPQFDEFSRSDKEYVLNAGSFNILYAPTWRHFGNPPLFDFSGFDTSDFSNFLRENDICIYLRLHPNFASSVPDEVYCIENIKDFSGASFPDIMEYLPQFDGLITDYSSVSLDFLPLNKPMIFMTSDYKEYDRQIGFCVDYAHWTPGYKPKSYEELKYALLDAKNSDSLRAEREALMNEYACQTDGNCERLARLLKEKGIFE